jgi:hypothetical protein
LPAPAYSRGLGGTLACAGVLTGDRGYACLRLPVLLFPRCVLALVDFTRRHHLPVRACVHVRERCG